MYHLLRNELAPNNNLPLRNPSPMRIEDHALEHPINQENQANQEDQIAGILRMLRTELNTQITEIRRTQAQTTNIVTGLLNQAQNGRGQRGGRRGRGRGARRGRNSGRRTQHRQDMIEEENESEEDESEENDSDSSDDSNEDY